MATLEIEKAFGEMQHAWHEQKSMLQESIEETKKFGGVTGELKASIEATNTRIDAMDVLIQSKMREMMLSASREALEERGTKSAKFRAFSKLLRSGYTGLEAEEQKYIERASKNDMETKVLTTGDSTVAGFLAPPEYVAEIIKPLLQYSPLRSYATVRTTNNRSIQVPIRKGTFAATWVAETGQRSETTGLKYGLEELPNHEMYAEVLISQQELEDSAFDMDAQIQMEATEQFAIAEGAAFVSGTGIGKPFGITTDPNLATTNAGSTSAMTYAGLVTLVHALKTPYAVNASWAMNRQSMGSVRSILDSQNRPLWEPSLAPGNPSTILGYPVIEMVDMPAIASAAIAAVFGDFKRAYTIVDRVSMVVQILREKYAEQGQIAYLIRKRVGGQLVLAEAVRGLKMS